MVKATQMESNSSPLPSACSDGDAENHIQGWSDRHGGGRVDRASKEVLMIGSADDDDDDDGDALQ